MLRRLKAQKPSLSGLGGTQRDQQHMLKKCNFKGRSDLENAKNRLGVSAQFRVGRSVATFCPNHRDGRETVERIVHEGHIAGFSLRRCHRNRNRPAGRCLAGTWRRTAGFNPRLCAVLFHCRHMASSRAAHGRLRLLLARNRSKHRSGSQNYEEQCRNDFGEKSHASLVRMPILSVLVCDLNHKAEHFLFNTSTKLSAVQFCSQQLRM